MSHTYKCFYLQASDNLTFWSIGEQKLETFNSIRKLISDKNCNWIRSTVSTLMPSKKLCQETENILYDWGKCYLVKLSKADTACLKDMAYSTKVLFLLI